MLHSILQNLHNLPGQLNMGYLLASSVLLFLLSFAHSIFGELLIFKNKREKGRIVPSLGGLDLRQRHLRIIWASWHLTSVLGWGMGFILLRLSAHPLPDNDLIVAAIATCTLVGALLVLVATEARHPGWFVLMAIGLLLVMSLF